MRILPNCGLNKMAVYVKNPRRLVQLLADSGKPRTPGVAQSSATARSSNGLRAYYEGESRWPTAYSGSVQESPEENWSALDLALRRGYCGLPGGSLTSPPLGPPSAPIERPQMSQAAVQFWYFEERLTRYPNQITKFASL